MYIFHSHLSLLWDTSGASIANVSLDVEKKPHHDPRKNDFCKAGRLIKGEQQVIVIAVVRNLVKEEWLKAGWCRRVCGIDRGCNWPSARIP